MRPGLTWVVVAGALTACGAWPEAPHSAPARILALFAYPGRSHQMVFEPLFRRLAERGHNVTVVSFFPVVDPPPPPTYRDVSLVGLSQILIQKVDMSGFGLDLWGLENFVDSAMGMFAFADLSTEICQKFFEWPSVRGLVAENNTYDVILVENFVSDCMLGFAERYDAPFVALLSHELMAWSSDRMGVPDSPAYVPASGTSFTYDMTLFQRLQNAIYLYYFKLWHRYGLQAREQAVLDAHFGLKTTDLDELARSYSVMLVNTHHSLNGVRPMVPGLVEVGGMHLHRPEQRIPPNVEKFLNESTEGVILFSFGSLVKSSTMPKEKMDIFVSVFKELPQRVIWKWEGEMEGAGDNIMTLKWIPQHQLLLHPKVVAFIAHGGLLGMTEAADAGVPMLVVPLFGDQPTNAAAAQDVGLATVLPYKHITHHTLRAALQKVLSPESRRRASQLSRVWHDRAAPPLDTAVYWVERTARLRRLQRAASPARHLPAYRVALLDVAALGVAAALVAALVMRLTVRLCLRAVGRTAAKIKQN